MSELRHTRVLVVEDERDSAEGEGLLLKLRGHQVHVAYDGPTAIESARANSPDVMLIDIGLPVMDGYEVARRVRRDPELKHIVMVALTGYGREEDRREAIAAGFDYHLAKPVDVEVLLALIARIAKETSSGPSAPY